MTKDNKAFEEAVVLAIIVNSGGVIETERLLTDMYTASQLRGDIEFVDHSAILRLHNKDVIEYDEGWSDRAVGETRIWLTGEPPESFKFEDPER